MRGRAALLVLPVIMLVAAGRADGQTLPPDVQRVIDQLKGKLSFAAKDLKTGESLAQRPDEKVQTASVIKLPILVEVFAQAKEHRLSLADVVAVTDANRVGGSGILQDLQVGLHLTVRDAAVLMVTLSDNTATNILIDKVGIAAVNDRMRQIGLRQTVLYRKVFKPPADPVPEEQKRWGLGVTTAGEMLALLEKIYRKEILDPASCDEIVAILKQQQDRDQIPRLLVGPAWEKTQVAHKTGALDQVRNDVGIVYTPAGDYVLSLFAQEAEDRTWSPDNQATMALARLSLAILHHFRRGTAGRQVGIGAMLD